MLEQLTIRNLALLKEVGFMPAKGLSVVSGLTGGGKSLVIQALSLLRGEKGKSGLVRRGARSASIDGVFLLSTGERSEGVRELYGELLGSDCEDDRIIISRVLDPSGKSRARIDGRPVTIKDLQRFGSFLIEIHGQGRNSSLMRQDTQTEMLDAFAGLALLRRSFKSELLTLRQLQKELTELRGSERESKERLEFLRYCLREIDAVTPHEGEFAELQDEARILANVDLLKSAMSRGIEQLYEGRGEDGREELGGDEQSPLIERLSLLARELAGLQALDSGLEEPVRLLDEGRVLLETAVAALRDRLGRLYFDEGRAQEIEERMSALSRLLDRFGPEESQLHDNWKRMKSELSAKEERSADPVELASLLEEKCKGLELQGKELTRKRRSAAKKLAKLLIAELQTLGMERVEIEIRVIDREGPDLLSRACALGTSEVAIYLAPNPGEPMMSLRETASGGEVARVMLVMKKVLAEVDHVPLLVFDEADSEIGGRLGFAVGRKLRALAKRHQVICVTHLPQIAVFADSHFLVDKKVFADEDGGEERTCSELRVLPALERQRELASMARGEDGVDAAALLEADRLLDMAKESPG